MSLTKSDLSSIRDIVSNEIKPLSQRLDKVDSRLEKVDLKLNRLEKGQKNIARELDKWAKFFDKNYVKLERRVITIESKLDITPPEF